MDEFQAELAKKDIETFERLEQEFHAVRLNHEKPEDIIYPMADLLTYMLPHLGEMIKQHITVDK